MKKVFAIIVAAGAGKRMEGSSRKQYLLIKDRPILSLTLTAIDSCKKIDKIFLVVPERDFDFCYRNILADLSSTKNIQLVAGGSSRQKSVYNGLAAIKDKDGIVVIHDGVRPFIRPEQIEVCIDHAVKFGACVLGIPAHDTLKRVNQEGLIKNTVIRDTVWLSQTPQAFRLSLLKRAHEQAKEDGYSSSDDAGLVERLEMSVKIIAGSKYNIKITTKEDLFIAEALMAAGLV